MRSDLAAFLQQYDDLVLVNFWEENCEASTYMARLLDSIEQFRQVPVLKLLLAEHREWADLHGVHGTPALIAYYRHQPILRVMGRITPEELRRCFQNQPLQTQAGIGHQSADQATFTAPSRRLQRPEEGREQPSRPER
jgi:hypothetical protein